ncbi:MAG: MCP four helix bundle domain-containing protein [Spirochaetes bacterium]|nr:MCP four helix bundle domain-containing protein [Spirochaetota bacterium]
MKWFNNLKVGKKVFLSSFIFLVIIFIISIMSIISLRMFNNNFIGFYNDRFMPVTQLNTILQDFLHIRVNMGISQTAAEDNDWNLVRSKVEETKKYGEDYQNLWKKYMSTSMDSEEKALAADFEKIVEPIRAARAEYQKALDARDLKRSKAYLDKWMEGYTALEAHTVKMIKYQENYGKQMMNDQNGSYNTQLVVSIIVLAIAIGLGIVVTMLLSRAVSVPVAKGLGFAQQLADGDLTTRIDLDQEDELGRLAKALNSAADSLENLISNVIVSSQNLSQAVEQIASGNQNLSQRTSEQASSLEEIASTIEEATATINQNADNAGRARDLTETGSVKSVEGNKIAVEAVSSITDMNESSKKVADIIAVINEIAFQTNLLALNAAVEAARAGEQGRGFAVVAGEVRNLAQRSGNAAKEIETLIKDTVSKVDKSTELVNKTGSALNEIAEAAKTSVQIITEIAAASMEQKQGINQINNAITEMDTMTQQNASLVEETASASEEMANQAAELLDMVQRFKISDEIKNGAYSQKHRELHLKAAAKTPGAEPKKEKKDGNGRMKSTEPKIAKKAEGGSMNDILKQEGFEEF